ncbi:MULTISPECIES: hypothetical protein [Sphingomonadaceae]|uniref:Uncharacterized protein n=1 Tax=Sphingomonas bisphenolicum TaxID=296544 RepID=A0ABM7G4Z1_9SPHN|nr:MULTISPECIES: hypothetical protein [Sphingomonadaceae]MBZ9649004.1 hypothetical protein [Sphingobium sp. 3R8]BBF71082.1 hypothetical protein SBA_ch1_32820 [Sphingomonas bisphenolicum]
MKPIILSLSASLLALGVTIAPFALAQPDSAAPLVEGKDRPILLQRMVVTATPLP